MLVNVLVVGENNVSTIEQWEIPEIEEDNPAPAPLTDDEIPYE